MHRRVVGTQRGGVCRAAVVAQRTPCMGSQGTGVIPAFLVSAHPREELTPPLWTTLCRSQVNSLIATGQWWRLLTPALLHGGMMHLFVNCYSLNDIGPAAERLLGPQRFTCLYVASAVSGNVASYYFNPGPGVGASGAIFGLVGCLAVYFSRHRRLYGRMGELKLECVPVLICCLPMPPLGCLRR